MTAQTVEGGQRVADAASVQDLDDLMFTPAGWFAIAADNQAVKGVRVSSLQTGLTLIGQGQVATIVGRLRPEISVIDVDLTGERAHFAVAQLTSWCRTKGLWFLVRPSGGAEGRAHVFTAPAENGAQLSAYVDELRSTMRASPRAIDLRTSGHIRPLSAPHRNGAYTRPRGDVRASARGLRAQTAAPNVHTTPARKGRASGGTASLVPRPRRRVDLPAAWAEYMRTGVAPSHGGRDHSRTTDELLATGAMIRAGHTAETAWALLCAAHPDAMVRARASRRRWIAWVWNPAVENDYAHTPASDPDPDVAVAVAHARDQLTALMWSVPARGRRSLLLVGHHVLDRMARANSRRVPVPERDLVQDTCLTDRKTIRHALRLLGSRLGTLHTDTWDPKHRDSSSFEFEIPQVPIEGMRQIPPPSFHTPLARGLWSQLPGQAHTLWRTLLAHEVALTPADLAQHSGLTPTPTDTPSASQLRSTIDALTDLARAGLAHCTADGEWSIRNAPTPELIERAAVRHNEIVASVDAERRAYRANATSGWDLAQARAHKVQLAKERAWWMQLDSTERLQRRGRWQETFEELPLVEQEQLKARLATRRTRAGISEPERHGAWLQSLDSQEYTERSTTRQRRYENLPPPLQVALAQSWQRHRDRFGITRGRSVSARDERAELLADTGPADRDRAFLDAQLRVVGDAVYDVA